MEKELIKQIKTNIENITSDKDKDLIDEVNEALEVITDETTKKELINLLNKKITKKEIFNEKKEKEINETVIINAIQKNIDCITSETKDNAIDAIKNAINNINDETIKNLLSSLLVNKINSIKKNNVNTKTVENKIVEVEKSSKKKNKKINAKVIILTGAMGLGLFGASFALANRNNTTNNIDEQVASSSSESFTTNNQPFVPSSRVQNDSSNFEVSNEKQTNEKEETNLNNNIESTNDSSNFESITPSPTTSNEIVHSTDTTNASQETEDRINLLSQQMDDAGLAKINVQTMQQEEKLKYALNYLKDCYTVAIKENLAQYKNNATDLYNHLGCSILNVNEATGTNPIYDYAKNKGIDTQILIQFYMYESGKEMDYLDQLEGIEVKGNYNSDLQNDSSLYPMSEEQFERLEDLIISLINDYYNEMGIDDLYFIIEDSETIQQINEEKYGYTYVIQ